jgi:hypothetical protein
MIDTNNILYTLLCKDLSQEKDFNLFLIWYDFCKQRISRRSKCLYNLRVLLFFLTFFRKYY